jgi:hypothetical protein
LIDNILTFFFGLVPMVDEQSTTEQLNIDVSIMLNRIPYKDIDSATSRNNERITF